MCFGSPSNYMHTDRHTDANDTIYIYIPHLLLLSPILKILCRRD